MTDLEVHPGQRILNVTKKPCYHPKKEIDLPCGASAKDRNVTCYVRNVTGRSSKSKQFQ